MKEIASSSEFDEKIKTSSLVLVDFWAPWCGPCRMIGPILEKLSKEFEGKAEILKVNVDDHSDIAAKFKITSIPTIIFFKNGQVVEQVVGALPQVQLNQKIKKYL
jgi:thioredoxin 1